jgi:hypothetical protein
VAAAIAAALVVLVVAGCGGSGNDSSTPLTKSQYLKRGNQVCKKGLEEKDQAVKAGLEEIPRDQFPKLSQQNLKKLGEAALPALQEAVTELAELPPPAEDKAEVEKFVGQLESAAKKTEANPALLAQGDPFREGGNAAKAYGLEDCRF